MATAGEQLLKLQPNYMNVFVHEIDVEDGPFERPLTIAPSSSGNANWVTVLVGENGSRKSFLLRLIHASARGASSFRTRNGNGLRLKIARATEVPTAVIAISGTAIDRFTHASLPKESYTYLGLRSTTGASGYHQSQHCFVSAILNNRQGLQRRRAALERVFAHLGLLAKFDVFFRLSKRASSLRTFLRENSPILDEKLRDVIARGMRSTLNRGAGDELTAFAETSDGKEQLLSALRDLARATFLDVNAPAPKPSIRFSGNRMLAAPKTLPIAIWQNLLTLGIIEVSKTEFYPSESNGREYREPQVDGNDLSSGQWSWLNGLGGLCVCLGNGTLVLVDEPENSLHPSWQLEYVPTILSILEDFTGCHVIVATHSPLIQSGLPPEKGNVRTLRRDDSSPWSESPVRSIETVPTFGWTASDVYEEAFNLKSTRAPLFTEVADLALRTIADGRKISKKETDRLVDSLERTSESLQPLDPMRDVIDSVISELNPVKK
ncbi:AAA family ATPase [Paraburkholderia sp. EG285A]|uniref:AAA family ATPase n=1 Tax=Paraburkholderia sp. EG285A TaxID=3237009 RepID=UPI0034D243EF